MKNFSPLCYVIEPTGRFRNEMEKESGKPSNHCVTPLGSFSALLCPIAISSPEKVIPQRDNLSHICREFSSGVSVGTPFVVDLS